ncbi:DUF3289 family protein [Erwinia pyrifoliae]|uniref:DUF3289 family protein n=2 Tax=Erwinia pyrifoliae TaxID=79967 RepID=A0ABY5XDK7_ERWPY|nr:DUF3289 family protein [Erwinia pyrifoliae]
MRCGDLTEAQLKTHYHLMDISTRANPFHSDENHPVQPAAVNVLWFPWRR